MRGYLIGSGWKDYQRTGEVCGIALPAGLRLADRLPEPIFTPSTKAERGQHDENVGFAHIEALIGRDRAAQVRDTAIALYRYAAELALARGIIIADTKFEFGVDETGTLTLIDEALTPDSSRFWPVDTYQPGASPPSFDKQFVRDYLETLDWDKRPPAPKLAARRHPPHQREIPGGAAAADGRVQHSTLRFLLLRHAAMTRCSSRTPSVSAAGPGCRMIDDLTSCSSPSRTAGTSAQPGRAATARGLNFLPHQEPKIRSGARRGTSSGSAMMRSRPSPCCASSGTDVVAARHADQLGHPADAGDLRLVPFLEVHPRPTRQSLGADRIASSPAVELRRERRGLRLAADHPAQRADDPQDLRRCCAG